MTLLMLFTYVVLAGVPAYYFNRRVMQWLKPKESFKNFILYMLAMLSIIFLDIFIVGWILFKYVWLLI